LELPKPEDNILDQIWTQALSELKGQMTRLTFDGRLASSKLIKLEKDSATLEVRTGHDKDWIDHTLKSKIQTVLTQLLDYEIELKIEARFIPEGVAQHIV